MNTQDESEIKMIDLSVDHYSIELQDVWTRVRLESAVVNRELVEEETATVRTLRSNSQSRSESISYVGFGPFLCGSEMWRGESRRTLMCCGSRPLGCLSTHIFSMCIYFGGHRMKRKSFVSDSLDTSWSDSVII